MESKVMTTETDSHTTEKPVILIAEDHGVLRRSLRDLLSVNFPQAVIYEAENGKKAVTLAVSHRPQAVLMDIAMPELNGLEATRRIKANQPDTQVIILTIHEAAEYRASAAEAGASVYVSKRRMGQDLIPAVSEILRKPNQGLNPEGLI